MIFNDFATNMPLVSIIVFSFLITLGLTYAYKFLTKQEELKALKERTKKLQADMKIEKDQNKLMDLQKEMMKLSMEQMKHSMKPMMFTFIPLIFAYAGLRGLYKGAGDMLVWGVNLPIVGTGAGWFLCYVISSIIFSMILRKMMKVN